MDDAVLIKLLYIELEQNRKIAEVVSEGGFVREEDPEYFKVDMLGVVLDALGFPEDNSSEQYGLYGKDGAYLHPDTYDRSEYYQDAREYMGSGTEQELRATVEFLRECSRAFKEQSSE